MTRFILSLIMFLLIPCVVWGADFSDSEYNNALSNFDLSVFEDRLGDEAYSILDSLGLSEFDFNSINFLNIDDVFNIIKSMLEGKIQTPLKCCVYVLGFIILTGFVRNIDFNEGSLDSTVGTISALIISSLILTRMSITVATCVTALNIASDFIYGFIPVFCAITIASGGPTVAFSTNSLLLLLSQGLSFLASNFFMPTINCFFALAICSSINEELHLNRLVGTLKRIITTCISFIFGVFVSILSIKTAVASRADMLGLRSIRFAVNSIVPVIGSSISEGLLSIQGYSSLIKSSVGIVGIIGVCLVFLPVIIEVGLWRLMLSVCSIISDVFNVDSLSSLLSAIRDAMLLMNVLLIMSMVTTIISIGIIVAAKGGA